MFQNFYLCFTSSWHVSVHIWSITTPWFFLMSYFPSMWASWDEIHSRDRLCASYTLVSSLNIHLLVFILCYGRINCYFGWYLLWFTTIYLHLICILVVISLHLRHNTVVHIHIIRTHLTSKRKNGWGIFCIELAQRTFPLQSFLWSIKSLMCSIISVTSCILIFYYRRFITFGIKALSWARWVEFLPIFFLSQFFLVLWLLQ